MKAIGTGLLSAAFVGILVVGAVRADTVGTGSFSIDIHYYWALPSPMSGQIVFDDVTRSVFGTPVNLGVAVGTAVISIADPPSAILTYVDGAPADYGTFASYSHSVTPGVLTLDTQGNYVCAVEGCASGGSFIGTSTTVSGTLPATWPPGLVYTGEGGDHCCIGAQCSPPVPSHIQHCAGTFALNAFQPQNTPANNNPPPLALSGTFYNTLSEQLETVAADLTFTKIASAGTTTLTGTSNAAGSIDPNFQLDIGGFKAVFFDVTTTASYTGKVTLCSYYQDDDADGIVDGTSVLETSLVLLHREGSNFVPVQANKVDTALNRVCGSVSSLSPFALAVSPLGNLPESLADLKCESRVAFNNWRLARDVTKCHAKAVGKAFDSRTFDLAACEAAARTKYDQKNANLFAAGCPTCLVSNASTLGDMLQALLRVEVAPKTFCGGTTPIGF